MTPLRTRSSLDPPAQELPSSLVQHPSSPVPPFFRSPSPHQPSLVLARSMISSEVGGELALPHAASSQRLPGSLPAPLHPRPLPTSRTAQLPLLPAPRQHLTSGALARPGAGRPRSTSPIPLHQCLPGVGISTPASHGIPSFPARTRRWVTEVTLECLKTADPNLSLENGFVG